jgi:glycosyltransferase involved in cell wall biosynthesis
VNAPSKEISIVVAAHDFRRELPRTIRSLSPPYQTGIDPASLEILIVDNGSAEPVAADWFEEISADLKILRFPPGNPSPCAAINAGVAAAQGDLIAVLIDGARIASPGFIARARSAMRLADDVFVATMGFHLGPEPQQISLNDGYDAQAEDRLLAEIGWPAEGYRLFEIAARGQSYAKGVLAGFPETTAFMMRRSSFRRLGGFHEGFRFRGGGLANFEFFERVLRDEAIAPIVLIGEGTFHQVHRGTSTRAGGVMRRASSDGPTLWEQMAADFEEIVGRPPLSLTLRKPLLFGKCETEAAERAFFGEDD